MAAARVEAEKYHELVVAWGRAYSFNKEHETSTAATASRLRWLGWQLRAAYVNTVMAVLLDGANSEVLTELVVGPPGGEGTAWLLERLEVHGITSAHDGIEDACQNELIQIAASLLWMGDLPETQYD